MKIVNNPIGLITFMLNEKITITEVHEDKLVGKCTHGDEFDIPLDYPLFEQVKYDKDSKDQEG